MFSRLFRKDPNKQIARRVYDSLVRSARQPAFYGPGAAPDTVDGRFDLIVLHAILVMRRLRDGDAAARDLSQSVFDIMFDDMDAALREMGTGDLSVGKKIKEMGEAFYGRAKAYEDALKDGDEDALADVIARNMFEETETDPAFCHRLAVYVIDSANALNTQSLDSLLQGHAPVYAAYD